MINIAPEAGGDTPFNTEGYPLQPELGGRHCAMRAAMQCDLDMCGAKLRGPQLSCVESVFIVLSASKSGTRIYVPESQGDEKPRGLRISELKTHLPQVGSPLGCLRAAPTRGYDLGWVSSCWSLQKRLRAYE